VLADRLEPYLKIACLCLAILIILQLTQRGRASDPLRDLRIITPPPAPAARPSPPTAPPTRPGSKRAKPLSPDVAALVDTINKSETFGPVKKPQPIQLLGIAGEAAFLQDPNGQEGLAREGETFNGIKLLRIGINRVLIEHQGEEKELTLFSGIGSDSLIEKDNQ